MSLRINLNSAALTATRNLAGSDNAMGKSIERLSSGFKINNAGDDPAGLVISEKLRAQVSGLGQAIKNSSDAVNMVKTAEGALNETHSLLRSMRDLALHAANAGANDSAATAADQAQINSAIETLNKISAETQFGQKKLLDGSASLQSTFSTKFDAVNLGNSGLVEDTAVTVDVTTAATQVSYVGNKDLSANITNAETVMINGVSVDFAAGTTLANAVQAINDKSGETGVTASVDTAKFIKLTGDFGSAADIDISGSGVANVFGVAAKTAGVDAVATVKDADGANVGGTWTGAGKVLSDTEGSSITLSSSGNAVATLSDEINVTAGTLQFQVGAYAGQTRSLNITSSAAAELGKNTTGVEDTDDVSKIDVTSVKGAQEAIKVLDAAITQVSTQRAELGAFQRNVLESNINSLSIAKENIAASESTIRDTDMAAEMVNFTRNQIMNQAGVSMLSQANQAPQTLLSLLR